ncbi:hypothetical protein GMMP15_1370047 [Candidatus Magnetomoraceae bacterium gMMP-15]
MKKLFSEEATQLINKIARYTDSTIKMTSHCRCRMVERCVDFQDILLLLSNGKVNTQSS